MSTGDLFSGAIDSFLEGWKEAKAEHVKRATPLYYWCKLFEFHHSPREFYALVEQNLDKRQVPGLLKGFTLLHEGTVFSPKRLYLQMRRERVVFEICAAHFGTGFFTSSRLFDRRRDATLLDYIMTTFIFTGLGAVGWTQLGAVSSIAIVGCVVTLWWSLMRLGVSMEAAQLDEHLTRIPFLGRIYETLFHPNTYFRQDQTNMYREAVHRAMMDAVADLTAQKGLKPLSESETRPILPELR